MTLLDRKQRRNLRAGISFLAPNIMGFLSFTLIPLGFSMMLAFSNWDLRRHNMFQQESLKLVGLENFIRLLSHPDFWRFLGNTLFIMMGIPFSIAGSLLLAILLSKDLRGRNRRTTTALIATAGLIAGALCLFALELETTGMGILFGGLLCVILLTGTIGGSTVYRTLFYTPHFTAGVATFILWKKLYNPHNGPINRALAPLLHTLTHAVHNMLDHSGDRVFLQGMWLCFGLMTLLIVFGLMRLGNWWKDGELGSAGLIPPLLILLTPAGMAWRWSPDPKAASMVIALSLAGMAHLAIRAKRGRDYTCTPSEGFGGALMFSLGLTVSCFVLLGCAVISFRLPSMAADGLEAPQWLSSYHWAKPSLMLMGIWGAVGSNNMLLYLAGLSGVPEDLYEAAAMDGASGFQRFWHVTWPQLAPTTFFIVVMSVIHGLQGGFEMARTMTEGGPAGATTTLSYFIYIEGFSTGRLGFTSAVAWTLFFMVLSVTLFNWKFGNRYVNE